MIKSVAEIFNDSAVICGGNTFIETDEKSMSYKEFNEYSDKIANFLLSLSIKKGDRVALFLEKRIETVACIAAVLKVGAIFVPLDINAFSKRNTYILEESGSALLFASSKSLENLLKIENLPELVKKIVFIDDSAVKLNDIEVFNEKDYSNCNTGIEICKIEENQPATILFTSGSTGYPKGAVITHESIMTFINWVKDEFNVKENDKFISHAPLFFDLSLLDIFAPVITGSSVFLVSDEKVNNAQYLLNVINDKKISIWQSVPSILILMVLFKKKSFEDSPFLRCVLFAGEAFPVKYFTILTEMFKHATFYNIYGCTETNDTFFYKIEPQKEIIPDPLPIGIPLPYVDYMIVDENYNQINDAEKGELLVHCPTLLTKYWNDTVKEVQYLVKLNHKGREKPFYKTKDIVSKSDDGNFYFHGRLDNIIKSSGYRINVLEIEAILQENADILESVVFGVDDETIGKKIFATVKTKFLEALTVIDIKKYCSEKMPKYMIPHMILIEQDIKKTGNGKIDRQYYKNLFIKKNS